MKKILVFPGTRWQEGLIKKVKEMGHQAVLVSPEKNPCCRYLADLLFQSDIFDIDRIARFCICENIDAIISDECDIAVPVLAQLGERLGLPAASNRMAELYTNKFYMREFCREHGIPYPEYKRCRNLDEAAAFLNQLGCKMIIKPLDSNASHGVFLIENKKELEACFGETMSFSRKEKAVLAERYIEGTEFTVDGIKTPRKHYTLAVSEKKHFPHNPNIAYELFFTHNSQRFPYNLLKDINDRFIMESGLEYAFTHAEYKYENDTFYLIEAAARGGGNQISSVIAQYLSGYDTYKYLIECALGEVKEADFSIRPEYEEKAAVLHFFSVPRSGVVRRVHGSHFLENHSAVLDFSLNFTAGDMIQDAVNDSSRIGYYIAGGSCEEEVRKFMETVQKKFWIEVEK